MSGKDSSLKKSSINFFNSLETIKVNIDAGVAKVTLNRPDRLNAINLKMLEEIKQLVELVEKSNEVRVVVITGGGKYFSAGADIVEVSTIETNLEAFEYMRNIQLVFNSLTKLPKPVLAAVNGLALGGGCEMALACDLRIASENATFGVPEIDIGVLPGGGGTQRLPRLLGICKAKEMLYTGRRITAKEAYDMGMINKVVQIGELQQEVDSWAKEIAAKPSLALKEAKHLVNTGIEHDLETALKMEAYSVASLFASVDKKEGMQAFLEKRKAVFKGK